MPPKTAPAPKAKAAPAAKAKAAPAGKVAAPAPKGKVAPAPKGKGAAAVKAAKKPEAKAKVQPVKKVVTKRRAKVHTSVQFRRPHTRYHAKKPQYSRSARPEVKSFDVYKVLRHPITSEAAMRQIESNNTLVFITALRATKRQIRRAAEKIYSLKVARVNTLIRPDGQKKAFIKLPATEEALAHANKIGIL